MWSATVEVTRAWKARQNRLDRRVPGSIDGAKESPDGVCFRDSNEPIGGSDSVESKSATRDQMEW